DRARIQVPAATPNAVTRARAVGGGGVLSLAKPRDGILQCLHAGVSQRRRGMTEPAILLRERRDAFAVTVCFAGQSGKGGGRCRQEAKCAVAVDVVPDDLSSIVDANGRVILCRRGVDGGVDAVAVKKTMKNAALRWTYRVHSDDLPPVIDAL